MQVVNQNIELNLYIFKTFFHVNVFYFSFFLIVFIFPCKTANTSRRSLGNLEVTSSLFNVLHP